MSTSHTQPTLDLSVVIPSKNEGANLDVLLPQLREALADLSVQSEIIVVDAASGDGTPDIVASHGARYVGERAPGYGNAILTGARAARGAYIVTMDADHSHPARFIADLWAARTQGDLVIASRYVEGGHADQPLFRLILSKILNAFFRIGLTLSVLDLSSGFRLYHHRVFHHFKPRFVSFVFLVELLLHIMREGRNIAEIPFQYEPRDKGRSNARIIQFGMDYCRLFYQMWRIRNACTFPDYDWRAYESRIPLQRWWHRRRIAHILRLADPTLPLLNVGCGSSRILSMLPAGAVGVELDMGKLRFQKRSGRARVQASGGQLPAAGESIATIVCSQAIGHVPNSSDAMLDEFARVLKPGGCLVIGVPDNGAWPWRLAKRLREWIVPGARELEHVNTFTFDTLTKALEDRGFELREHAYICGAELIVKARKGGESNQRPPAAPGV